MFKNDLRHGQGMNIMNSITEQGVYMGDFTDDVSNGVGLYSTTANNQTETYLG